MISEKTTFLEKILLAIWESFLYESNYDYNLYKFGYKFAFIPFLFFHKNQKQELNFQQFGGLVTKNIYAFRVALYFKGMSNSIDLYIGILLQ